MNAFVAAASTVAEGSAAADHRPAFVVRSFGLSDRGRKRQTNEDCFFVAELARTLSVQHTNLPQTGSSLSAHRAYVFLVADGMGGKNAGEVASELGVTSIQEFLLNTLRRFSNLQPGEEPAAMRAFEEALCQADARILEESSRNPEWEGMGTTLTMAFAANWRLFVAHAGDSRCYLYSGGKLQQLTNDHTVIAELARRGAISAADAAGHPLRHVMTNFLGGKERGVQVEVDSLDLQPDDVVLLCSDGLTEMVPPDQIAAILAGERDPQRACGRLIAEANERGGRDNITVIVSCVGEAPA